MTEDEPGQGADAQADVRLTALDARLGAAQQAEAARTGGGALGKPGKGYSQGSRVLYELIAGPAGGALIGFALDHWLGTSPWLLLVLLFGGIAVAFRNIIRIAGQGAE